MSPVEICKATIKKRKAREKMPPELKNMRRPFRSMVLRNLADGLRTSQERMVRVGWALVLLKPLIKTLIYYNIIRINLPNSINQSWNPIGTMALRLQKKEFMVHMKGIIIVFIKKILFEKPMTAMFRILNKNPKVMDCKKKISWIRVQSEKPKPCYPRANKT